MQKISTHVGSRQDGEDPHIRTETEAEIARPASHGGAGAPVHRSRPKNREVENEMVKVPEKKGKPPKSATDPTN